MRLWIITAFAMLASAGFSQTFTEVSTGIIPNFFGAADFADYDNDGDQDLAIIGVDNDFNDIADIFRNDEGVFTPLGAGISPMHMGAISWADYDNDGDYDLLCSGQNYSMQAFAEIYENNDGVFTPVATDLPAGFWNSTGWGDMDNDGDLDLAYSWYAGNISYSAIFRNDDGVFIDINAGLPGLTEGSMEWSDYDGDGDADLLITGTPDDFSNTPVLLYRNDDGDFVNTGSEFLDCAWYNNALWDDADNDGDPDILFVADDGENYFLVVYFNTESGFELMNTGLEGVRTSNGNIAIVTGDIDNDGDSDIIMTGDDPNYNHATKIYLNDGGSYSELEHDIPGFGSGTIDISDVDNDGDLDLLMMGYDNSFNADIGLFLNDANTNSYAVNEAPAAPSGLSAEVNGNAVTLTWEAATDDHTPQASLQYNLYIGTQPGLGDVVCAQSYMDPVSPMFGFHQLPKNGNCQYMLGFEMQELPDSNYYWSVQTIDQSGAASAFSEEMSFSIGNVTRITEIAPAVQLYPNPASEILYFSNQDGDAATSAIYDIFGRQVLQIDTNGREGVVDVSTLEPGIYFLKYEQNNRVESHTFIKK